MRCGYACELAARAQARADITVFPGMELDSATDPGHGGRIHVLVAFPPEAQPDMIGRIFADQAGIPSEADRDGQEEIAIADMRAFKAMVTAAAEC